MTGSHHLKYVELISNLLIKTKQYYDAIKKDKCLEEVKKIRLEIKKIEIELEELIKHGNLIEGGVS
jgi:hypothetical protein